MVDTTKQLIRRTIRSYLAAILAFGVSSTAMAGELLGYKGDRLKGSISCVHPNIIRDLADRLGEEENYTTVARIYMQQGYCIEADIPTILRKPLADHSLTTWDGHKAEIWETTLIRGRGDGTSEQVSSYSIVFPQEMEQNFTD